MKKLFVLTLLLVVFSFISCGGNDKSAENTEKEGTKQDENNGKDEKKENPDDGKTSDVEEGVNDIDLTGSVFEMPKINPSGNIPLSAGIPMKSAGIAKVTVKIDDKKEGKEDFFPLIPTRLR